ncbi:MAG: hypothetical protein QXI51_01975 [Candidatus Korarchaeum sp.]
MSSGLTPEKLILARDRNGNVMINARSDEITDLLGVPRLKLAPLTRSRMKRRSDDMKALKCVEGIANAMRVASIR